MAASSLVGAGAWAAGSGSTGTDTQAVARMPVSQDQAVGIALQNVPGAVQATEFENENGRYLWDVEIVNGAGQVIDVSIDANTGEMLASKAADIDDDNGKADHQDEDDDGDRDEGDHGPGQDDQEQDDD